MADHEMLFFGPRLGCFEVTLSTNRIGTYDAAVLAARHNIPFIAVAPISIVDFEMNDGSQIPIEHHPPTEARIVRGAFTRPDLASTGDVPARVMFTPLGLESDEENVYNLGFDVMPAELITAIVIGKRHSLAH
ncbi:hypothetical protein PISMIDRAFT_16801 [Pisolithus microcarpus 441]|uniref:Uncharacterized protein n=1 Tax=Pisolithus microcarpus 441 TaxID=765257 RepID=A0A0C9YY23_9AGAM|nr:hypothetical protein PISMIDRAFT_16801 [Pisolithus microcarpus 441]